MGANRLRQRFAHRRIGQPAGVGRIAALPANGFQPTVRLVRMEFAHARVQHPDCGRIEAHAQTEQDVLVPEAFAVPVAGDGQLVDAFDFGRDALLELRLGGAVAEALFDERQQAAFVLDVGEIVFEFFLLFDQAVFEGFAPADDLPGSGGADGSMKGLPVMVGFESYDTYLISSSSISFIVRICSNSIMDRSMLTSTYSAMAAVAFSIWSEVTRSVWNPGFSVWIRRREAWKERTCLLNECRNYQ